MWLYFLEQARRREKDKKKNKNNQKKIKEIRKSGQATFFALKNKKITKQLKKTKKCNIIYGMFENKSGGCHRDGKNARKLER